MSKDCGEKKKKENNMGYNLLKLNLKEINSKSKVFTQFE